MSVQAKSINWCSFDAAALAIDVAADPTPPASAALLSGINAVVQGVAVTPYAATAHVCYRHGYTAGGAVATSAVKLYFTLSVAPGAVHAKFASNDRMDDVQNVTPAYHAVWTTTGGTGAADTARIPMVAQAGSGAGNNPSFWTGQQHLVESSNMIDDVPATSTNRMLELPSFRHPVKEDCFCTAVMAWSCRVAHITSDLASL